MAKSAPVLMWFRQDLRLADNPALQQAAEAGKVLPVYILDRHNSGDHAPGGAGQVWLHHSLTALNKSLNNKLLLLSGDPLSLIPELCSQYNIEQVFWNRCYEPWRIQRDKLLKTQLKNKGISAHSSNGSLLWEPWTISTAAGTPYKVFTPFYQKGCLAAAAPRQPQGAATALNLLKPKSPSSVEALSLLPELDWADTLTQHWRFGEAAAQQQLQTFLQAAVQNYQTGRDFPAQMSVSRLSPYLHFGELSPNQIWHAAQMSGNNAAIEAFCRQLVWREFSYSLLFYNNKLPEQCLQSKYEHFPWRHEPSLIAAWQQGRTGIPFVDAGMRELWQTGTMHNRVRMVVASFLVKNLLQDWRVGERWFWDTLFDADLANNSAGWQWVAGCGADAAPFFRIFNPATQGEKFDPQGEYTRRFVPELKDLPNKYLFKPWEAPAEVLAEAGVKLGLNYPLPLVSLKESRQLALDALASIKQ
ncbi:MAG: DNA photolyase family protein [Cellvibrionaceae bacterium]|nr:DNA photolyase family protein [Cellvibrionaceae bacterium]MCV6624651.1 DNA photolyase family protein [Cellvibrionaceae bacterium]